MHSFLLPLWGRKVTTSHGSDEWDSLLEIELIVFVILNRGSSLYQIPHPERHVKPFHNSESEAYQPTATGGPQLDLRSEVGTIAVGIL